MKINKNTIIVILLIGLSVSLYFNFNQPDKKMTPEEKQEAIKAGNQIMLKLIEKSEESVEVKNNKDQKNIDCKKNAIARGEDMNSYMYRCYKEAYY